MTRDRDTRSKGEATLRKSSGEPLSAAAPLLGVAEIESELVRAAQRGDILAMSRLMDALAPWLGRVCGSIALEQGEDAAQEAMIQVLRDLPSLREPQALRGWARRIAVREAIRHAQRARDEGARRAGGAAERSARPRDADAIPDPRPGGAADPALARDVRSVLAALGPEQRAILVLRDLEGLSEAEAATLLGVAQGTVKSRLSRAREAFVERWSR